MEVCCPTLLEDLQWHEAVHYNAFLYAIVNASKDNVPDGPFLLHERRPFVAQLKVFCRATLSILGMYISW